METYTKRPDTERGTAALCSLNLAQLALPYISSIVLALLSFLPPLSSLFSTVLTEVCMAPVQAVAAAAAQGGAEGARWGQHPGRQHRSSRRRGCRRSGSSRSVWSGRDRPTWFSIGSLLFCSLLFVPFQEFLQIPGILLIFCFLSDRVYLDPPLSRRQGISGSPRGGTQDDGCGAQERQGGPKRGAVICRHPQG